MDEQPTREQFVAAYLTLPGTTREMAEAIYDILSGPTTTDTLVAIDAVCTRVLAQEGRDGE